MFLIGIKRNTQVVVFCLLNLSPVLTLFFLVKIGFLSNSNFILLSVNIILYCHGENAQGSLDFMCTLHRRKKKIDVETYLKVKTYSNR